MKQGWEIRKLGEVCENVSNINWKTISLDTKFPYIDLSAVDIDNSNIDDFEYINKDNAPSRAKQIVNTGDVIFATTRPLLKRVCVITKSFNNAIASTGFCVLRPKVKVVSKWIYYILKSDSFYTYIEPLQKGISYPAVSDNEVKNFSIPVPPLAEQEHIVQELDLLSGIIEKKRQQLKELDNLAQSIFYDMFGDPITNEKDWEVKKWEDVLTIINGRNQRAVENPEGIYPIYGSGGIMGYADKCLCPKDTIIIGRKGNINKPIYVREPFWNVDTAFGLVADNISLAADYLYFFCVIYDFEQLNKAVTIPSLTKVDLLKINTPVPPLTLQQEFASKIEAIEKQKAILKQSIEETETLFNSRMDYYFN